MQRRSQFTRDEYNTIKDLLYERGRSDRHKQKAIRSKLRKLGFYISDYGALGFTTADLDDMIARGRITITEAGPRATKPSRHPIDDGRADDPAEIARRRTSTMMPMDHMTTAPGHRIFVEVDGRKVPTLADILPDTPGLKFLFVAKTPVPTSVEAGHYFQGKQGKMFWNKLAEFRILNVPAGQYHDDFLLKNGYGITDIVKFPRYYGDEPTDFEYRDGMERILNLIKLHKPKVLIFVYKRVLDNILDRYFNIDEKSKYGFNDDFKKLFGAEVFVFPMPGTLCRREEANAAMTALAGVSGGAIMDH